MPQLHDFLDKLINNDPIVASTALARLGTRDIIGAEVVAFINEHIGRIYESPTARYYLAKLCGLRPSTTPELIDSIRSSGFHTKLVAAQCMRFITDSSAHPTAEGAMLELVDGEADNLVKAATEALGHLRAVRAAPRILTAAKRISSSATYALASLLRLIAADDMDSMVPLRFGYFNEIFAFDAVNKQANASAIQCVLPELRYRLRDSAIDQIVYSWINSHDLHLRSIGAHAVATFRIKRVRGILAKRIKELLEADGNDYSAYEMARAWGCIGATDESSLATLEEWYLSANADLRQCARLALSLSFPALMTVPRNRRNAFLRQLATDLLEGNDNELIAYLLIGLAGAKHDMELFITKLGSLNLETRAGAALALGIRGSKHAENVLRDHLQGTHSTSFERMMTQTALTRCDPVYADQLHKTLCDAPPITVWRMRHGTDPKLLHPHVWMFQLVTSLGAARRGGRRRAAAWSDVLMIDTRSDIVEVPRSTKPRRPRPRTPVAPKTAPPVDASGAIVQLLQDISQIVMKDKEVIGSYLRWDERTVNNLRVRVDQISRGLRDKTSERENFLIWAGPGSGKTFLIEEIARHFGDAVHFVNINFSKDSSDELSLKIEEIKSSTKPTLVLFDEVDARAGEAWLYENTFSLLDINLESETQQVVFVLIGSMAGGQSVMTDAMRKRQKGSDMVSRVPPFLHFEIPAATPEDQLVMISSQLEIACRDLTVKIQSIERLAAYYILASPPYKNPRHLADLIRSAVRRTEEKVERLEYDHLFEPTNLDSKRFWADNAETAEQSHNTFIQIR
jgi:hypothetical protein